MPPLSNMPCICICPGVVVGCTPKNFDGGVRHELLQPNPWLRRPRAKNRMLGYGKWVKIKPLTLGNVTLTTFEAILHAIGQIWPKSCHSLRKNGGIRSKFAENISLATEDQPKLEHWLRKSSQKYTLGYGNCVQKGTLAGSTPPVRNIDMNYSQGISKWKLYQNFLNISLISSPHSSEFMCLSIEKDTDAMNLQRPDLNPKPSYSKSRSIGRGGTLNAT